MKQMGNPKLLRRLIVPACIFLIVAGIWLFKNEPGVKPTEEVQPSGNPDFMLEAKSIDLKQLTAYQMPIIIDFGADWCAPCRDFAPILKAMNEEMQGKAIIKYIDIDKSFEVAASFPIQVIPTQIFITADGKPYVPSASITVSLTKYESRDTGEHLFTLHQGGLTKEQLRAILEDMGVSK